MNYLNKSADILIISDKKLARKIEQHWRGRIQPDNYIKTPDRYLFLEMPRQEVISFLEKKEKNFPMQNMK